MLGAPAESRDDVGLHCYQSFYNNVFNPVHHNLVVDSDFFEILGKLREIPLAGIFVRIIVIIFAYVRASILHVLIVLFVYRVVGQMDELLISCRLIRRVLFRRKSGQAFFEQVYFKRIKAGYEGVDPKVEFKTID
jgi:hypothetical protein